MQTSTVVTHHFLAIQVAQSGKKVINDTRWCAGLDTGREVCPRALVENHEVAQLSEGQFNNIY